MELIHCERCGGESPADARFCIDCGASLEKGTTGPTVKLTGPVCPTCRTVNPSGASFCVVCGRSLGTHAPAQPYVRPQQPTSPYSAPRQIHPRVDAAPRPIHIPQPPTSLPQRSRPQQTGINALTVLILGTFLLIATHHFWPGFMLVLGISILVSKINAGHPEYAFQSLVWLGGLALLFATGTFWPGILILVFISWMIDNGIPRRHHW